MHESATMHSFRLILYYKSLSFRRWLKASAFTLFVLGPLILTGFYLMLEPYLVKVVVLAGSASSRWPVADLRALSLTLTILLIAASLSATLRDVYATHSADVALDALPIPPTVRFNVTLLVRFLKNLFAWLALLVILHRLSDGRVAGATWTLMQVALTLTAFLNIAVLQILATLALVHYQLFSLSRIAAQAILLLSLVLLARWHEWFIVPLLPLRAPALIFQSSFDAALGRSEQEASAGMLLAVALAAFGVLYFVTQFVYQQWRDDDRELARDALLQRSGRREWLDGWLKRLLKEPVASQVVRDWRLTRRGFSSAVYLAVGFVVLFHGALVLASRRYELTEEWFVRLTLLCCAFSVFSLTALAPLLLKYQLPYFWVEKSTGISPELVWKSKFWYARLMALPAWFVSAAVALSLSSLSLVDEVWLLLKLVVIAFVVASLVGIMAFEIASRPLLGLVFSGLAALALAGLFIFYWRFWLLWLYGYVMAMHYLAARARSRVSFTEIEAEA